MKTRIAAFLLVAVMLFGAFSMSVNAEMPTLQSYITSVLASNPTGNIIISLPGDTVVTSATTIPSNITIYVGPGVKLFVNEPLTVNGELRSALSTNIMTGSNGSVTTNNSISNPTANYWTQYNPAYPWTINPPQGPYCPTCRTNTRIWCFTCSAYHCATCTPHYSQNIISYCAIHNVTKIYCARCGGYYCQSCDNGIHAYDSAQGRCITVPFTASATCPIHGVPRLYCPVCKIYYCQACIHGVHMNINGVCTVYGGVTTNFCLTHSVSKNYCVYCGNYYCPSCSGGYHVQSAADPTKCVVVPSGSVFNYNGGVSTIPGYYSAYNNYNYVYIPGYDYIAINIACAAPVASIASGSSVEEGTKVALTTSTPGAAIYYTTNGTVPSTSSAQYTEPIAITKDVTIHAVAISPSTFNSPVAKFIYKIKVFVAIATFKDLNGYPALAASLDKLLAKKVITAQSTFNPSGKVSWDDVSLWFTNLGVKVSSAKIDPKTAFSDSDKLTYEEMILACYKIMRIGKLIPVTRKQGSASIKMLKYSVDITNKAMYKAAYASFIENDVLYGLSFKPQDPANRAYLATAVAWAAGKIK